jgi:hypothetical protein
MKMFKVGDRLKVIDNDCRQGQIKIGATCKVIHTENFGRSVKVKFDDSSNWTENYLDSDRFELLPSRTLEQDLELARTFLNKDVVSRNGGEKFTVKRIKVYLKEDGEHRNSSVTVMGEIEKNGYCVTLIGNKYHIPVSDAVEPPISKTVKLNDTYNAVVTKTEVKVGCQTFPINKIRELIEANESL